MLGYWGKLWRQKRADMSPILLLFNRGDSSQAAAACWALSWHHTGMLLYLTAHSFEIDSGRYRPQQRVLKGLPHERYNGHLQEPAKHNAVSAP